MSEADGYRRAVRHILGASAEDAFVLGTQHSTGVFYFHPESERLLLARKEA